VTCQPSPKKAVVFLDISLCSNGYQNRENNQQIVACMKYDRANDAAGFSHGISPN
jgi:hypothetical protein